MCNSPRHVIIGCGNLFRKDDGIGVVVVHRLQSYFSKHPQPDLQIVEAGTNGIDVLLQAQGANKLTIIDACSSGSEAGVIFHVSGRDLIHQPLPSFNPHNFRWDHAVHAGRIIFRDEFPQDITAFLIEVSDTTFGTSLSPAVAASIEKTCAMITSLIHESSHRPFPTHQSPTL
ncbi:MAG TPA: hydrogenase maturation protease [Nitrospirales bacterium]|nr:hydrogenase maturation protease [Nitrospiraceae bacterium]HNP29479.1 hydrogenase maturation protease [Nitrospirales bacterium]